MKRCLTEGCKTILEGKALYCPECRYRHRPAAALPPAGQARAGPAHRADHKPGLA